MLNKDVFQFLKQLAINNNRDWFKLNKHLHDNSKKAVLKFSEQLFHELKIVLVEKYNETLCHDIYQDSLIIPHNSLY